MTTPKRPTPSKTRKAKRPRVRRPDDGSPLLRETGEDCFTERYLKGVLLGLNKEDCAAAAGCDTSTVRYWEKKAAEARMAGKHDRFRAFSDAVRAERAKLNQLCIQTVQRARIHGDWRAAVWFLDRHGYAKDVEIDPKEGGGAIMRVVIDRQDEECI